MPKIKVVVVDDSALIRTLLKEIINSQPDMEVIGAAPDPLVAREMIRSLNPDVITLDVEMPRMDGLDFLEKLMRLRPMPVLMISTLTDKGSDITLRALELGAVDFISKPKMDIQNSMKDYADEIARKIRIAAGARVRGMASIHTTSRSVDAVLPSIRNKITSTEKILVFGASTGGTEALKDVLIHMPPDCPGIVIAQHMPEGFTRSFAARLDSLCKISVKEAEHGDRILPGHAYLAPGHSHLLLGRSGANYVCELSRAEAVNRHRPSVDVLFRSAANHAGRNAVAVILTGMGRDGAAGMKEMHDAGAHTIAQDESSCVVFGMPKEAIARGGVDEILPLKDIPGAILGHLAALGGKPFRL
ncbi:chemotaxis response regulator protein-glutamate methylesterase [mine drainage metagenome]|uniref:protein-glutamate methylesterase n=1 Tax=mine drainage metagenome TaxID=410659 RepID=A0A1J5Q827_9ZZZZ